MYVVPLGVTSRTQPTPHVDDVGSVGRAAAVVATKRRYEDAPATDDQLNVGEVEMLVLELLGVMRVGLGKVPDVVRENTFPYTVVLPLLASRR